MKHTALVFFSLGLMGLSACMGPLFKGGSFEADPVCKIQREHPFSKSKLRLDGTGLDTQAPGYQLRLKATQTDALPQGLDLVMLLDTGCVLKREEEQPISAELMGDRAINPLLPYQAVSIQLPRAWSRAEFEAQLNADNCLVGVSFPRSYRTTALNDPALYLQRHHSTIRRKEGHFQFYHPDYGMKTRGEPLATIAILDTGVDWTHPDLAGAIWSPHFDGEIVMAPTYGTGVDATTIGGGEESVIYDGDDIDLSGGHGTHVAGLAAALGGNRLGGAGVMPHRAKIMAVRVFPADGTFMTSTENVVNGIYFAVDRGADIINMSLGAAISGPAEDPIYEAALQYAVDEGVVVVIAMGNATPGIPATEVDGVNFTVLPAIYAKDIPGVLSVASIDVDGFRLSSFSHYGRNTASLAAPGAHFSQGSMIAGVYSTRARGVPSGSSPHPLMLALPGTSMAAPLVAGAAALTVGLFRHHGLEKPSPAEIERLLLSSVRKTPQLGEAVISGGALDLELLSQQIHQDHPLTAGPTGRVDFSSEICP